MVHNKASIVAGIRMLLRRNYKIDPSLIDVEALVDPTLTFRENWELVWDKARLLVPQEIKVNLLAKSRF